ncbi:hypothetical protein BCR39DRAFT_522689 [Naematelia encephala]|uniref:Uncharacterized protein n=1 Tax=Naematelia encephala TaxID=71784 RepID=A0A1Y2BCI4_9TREE|nr:hypothetical protein BCR39DRAFT_522689 [Naematelia encephala]
MDFPQTKSKWSTVSLRTTSSSSLALYSLPCYPTSPWTVTDRVSILTLSRLSVLSRPALNLVFLTGHFADTRSHPDLPSKPKTARSPWKHTKTFQIPPLNGSKRLRKVPYLQLTGCRLTCSRDVQQPVNGSIFPWSYSRGAPRCLTMNRALGLLSKSIPTFHLPTSGAFRDLTVGGAFGTLVIPGAFHRLTMTRVFGRMTLTGTLHRPLTCIIVFGRLLLTVTAGCTMKRSPVDSSP